MACPRIQFDLDTDFAADCSEVSIDFGCSSVPGASMVVAYTAMGKPSDPSAFLDRDSKACSSPDTAAMGANLLA